MTKKRLVIMTVGKTHSGKTTFAHELEQKLENAIVMDQDNQAEFIHRHYKKLLPKHGPNTLKPTLTRLIIDYAIEETDLHLIVCNSNRSKIGRRNLLEGPFNKDKFVRILVHFDIPDDILMERVAKSERSTNILRVASNFKEVLLRQQADPISEGIVDPVEGEADYLFVVKDNEETEAVIDEIVRMADSL